MMFYVDGESVEADGYSILESGAVSFWVRKEGPKHPWSGYRVPLRQVTTSFAAGSWVRIEPEAE
jgi:hypothetical protein